MGRFVKSPTEYLKRERTFGRHLDEGPITAQCRDVGASASSASGVRVELEVNTTIDRRLDDELLARGVEIRRDDRVIGRLRQHRRGWWRKNRVLELVGEDPGRFPPGAHFRLRGWTAISLEIEGGRRLVGYWPLIRRLRVSPDATTELAVIFAAVEVGLQQPLIAWR